MTTKTNARSDFIQLNSTDIESLRKLAHRSPLAHSILWFFIERMDKNNAMVISQTALSEILDAHRVSINKAVKLLSEENWLEVVKVGSSNAYVVNSKVSWSKRFTQEQDHSVFSAVVIASSSEQPKPARAGQPHDDLRSVPVKK